MMGRPYNEQGERNAEEDASCYQRREESDRAESAEGAMMVSLSWSGNVDRGDQRGPLALHLLVKLLVVGPAHHEDQ